MGPLIVDYEAAMPKGRGGEMADDLKGMKVAILATDGVERIELEQPRGALYGAGASSDLLSIHSGEIQARQSDLISAGTFPVDHLVTDVSVEDYDALLLPGGTVNPDGLRIDPDAVGFVKAFVATGKPVAAICHGPWTLIEADVVRGHRFTSWPSLWTDLRRAGAEAIDEELVIDGQFTSSRSPADLPAFCPAIVAQFAKASVPGYAPGGMR
jgi:protease I